MSQAGSIVDALQALIEDEGFTVLTTATAPEQIPVDQFPAARILATDYDLNPLDYLQEQRVWVVSAALWIAAGTREDMQTHLEAIRDAVYAEPTLGGIVDRAFVASSLPESHSQASQIAGLLVLRAEKVD